MLIFMCLAIGLGGAFFGFLGLFFMVKTAYEEDFSKSFIKWLWAIPSEAEIDNHFIPWLANKHFSLFEAISYYMAYLKLAFFSIILALIISFFF